MSILIPLLLMLFGLSMLTLGVFEASLSLRGRLTRAVEVPYLHIVVLIAAGVTAMVGAAVEDVRHTVLLLVGLMLLLDFAFREYKAHRRRDRS